jgi:hypothetical protein
MMPGFCFVRQIWARGAIGTEGCKMGEEIYIWLQARSSVLNISLGEDRALTVIGTRT